MSEALASYYSLPGNQTACGEVFYESTVGVANKTLPCGTSVEICATRCAAIPVIDRGPYVEDRTFDLTPAAGEKIGFNFSAGVETVRYRVLG